MALAMATQWAGLTLDRPHIMGVVNVTPDSFSDGGAFLDHGKAIAHGLELAEAGADIIDIGGESTRPGSDAVPLDQELARILPVLEGLAGNCSAKLSIDTRKSAVMREAARRGAGIVNDVSAFTHDNQSLETAARSGCAVIAMHAQGDPKTMQVAPHYADVVSEVEAWLRERIEACERAGIARSQIAIDPGIGFGKTLEHNLQLLAHLDRFVALGVPVVLGVSRKSFIGRIAGTPKAADRVPGSLAAALGGVEQGVQIVRVHDVAETRQALQVWGAIRSRRSN